MKTPDSTNDLRHKLSKELERKRALLIDRHPTARNSLRIMLSALGVNSTRNSPSTAGFNSHAPKRSQRS